MFGIDRIVILISLNVLQVVDIQCRAIAIVTELQL